MAIKRCRRFQRYITREKQKSFTGGWNVLKYSGFEYEIDFDLERTSEDIGTIIAYEKIDKLLTKLFTDIVAVGPISNFKLTKNIKEVQVEK